MSNFDTSFIGKLSNKPTASKVKRLFIRVLTYLSQDGHYFVVGTDLIEGNEVLVRLSTAEESAEDLAVIKKTTKQAELPRYQHQYHSSAYPRETLEKKQRRGATLMCFDKAYLIGENRYRAHWANTMSMAKNPEFISGFTNVVIRQPLNKKPVGYIDIIERFEVLSPSDINKTRDFLSFALNNSDGKGARGHKIMWRIKQDGKVILTNTLYADSMPVTEKNQYGADITFSKLIGAGKALKRLMNCEDKLTSGLKISQELFQFQVDVNRTIIHALTGMPLEKMVSTGDVLAQLENMASLIKSGQLVVEAFAILNIQFGQDTLKKMLDKSDHISPISAYNIVSEDGETTFAGFLPTMAVIQRHASGDAYVVFVTPSDMFAKAEKLDDLDASMLMS